MDRSYFGEMIFQQNHRNNEFHNEGKAPLVLPAIRQKYGFPAKGETRFYFAISQSGEAIVIQQDYAPPSNGRISDEISVYRLMRTRRADYDKRFFQELASDFLFKTHSAEFPANEAIAIQTWSLFTEAITKNPDWHAEQFFVPAKPSANQHLRSAEITEILKYREICCSLTEQSLMWAAYISRSLNNSTNSKIQAILLATIDFDHPASIRYSAEEIRSALNCLPDCPYKAKGLLYLFTQQQPLTEDEIDCFRNAPAVQKELIEKYLNALYHADIEEIDNLCPLLSSAMLPSVILSNTGLTRVVHALLDKGFSNPRMHLELLLLCSAIWDDRDAQAYLQSCMDMIRSSQRIRHQLLMTLKENEALQKRFADEFTCIGYEAETALLRGEYTIHYIHDAYYLGLVKSSDYLPFYQEMCVQPLSDLLWNDFQKNESYGNIRNFYDHANWRIRRKVKRAFQKRVFSHAENSITQALQSLCCALAEKKSYRKKLKQIKRAGRADNDAEVQ
ncbi:hypothetical protein [Ruminococcus sp.]|uniref:hypothetical protein n=1 Tax=Ruminococcus sp. TaxID=41978 RepID=UPI002E786511|nr:hypothetical protein [Ruminococcus sp.]MEE1397944.1 hypothetical protein [Ruminococcus sp.]